MEIISRRDALKGLALIVVGDPVLFGDAANSYADQPSQVKQEEVFGTYEEFYDALINQNRTSAYFRKLQYAHDNPQIAIQLFHNKRQKKFDDLKEFYYPKPKIAHSWSEAMGPNLVPNLNYPFQTGVALAFALKEELGVGFRLEAVRPNTSDLVVMAILAFDNIDFLNKIGVDGKMYDARKKIYSREKEIINMGFQNFSRYYKGRTRPSSSNSFPSAPKPDPTGSQENTPMYPPQAPKF